MTAKHASPEYRASVRVIRAQVRQAWARGDDVHCWRCSGVIPEGMPYDVGHLDPFGGEGVDNLAPEHRTQTGKCPGNRNLGGRAGARITNAATATTTLNRPPWA